MSVLASTALSQLTNNGGGITHTHVIGIAALLMLAALAAAIASFFIQNPPNNDK